MKKDPMSLKRKDAVNNFTCDLKKTKLNSQDPTQIFDENFRRKRIAMDGNCLYRAITYCLYENEDKHHELREQIYKYAIENKKYCLPLFKQIEGNKSYDEHIKQS